MDTIGRAVSPHGRISNWKYLKMTTKKVSAGQMWKSEQTGEVFVVTSLYRDVLASFAMLRAINSGATENNKRAKVVRVDGGGECIMGFSIAEQV